MAPGESWTKRAGTQRADAAAPLHSLVAKSLEKSLALALLGALRLSWHFSEEEPTRIAACGKRHYRNSSFCI